MLPSPFLSNSHLVKHFVVELWSEQLVFICSTKAGLFSRGVFERLHSFPSLRGVLKEVVEKVRTPQFPPVCVKRGEVSQVNIHFILFIYVVYTFFTSLHHHFLIPLPLFSLPSLIERFLTAISPLPPAAPLVLTDMTVQGDKGRVIMVQ